jgi:DNA-binding transcriptional ArsR family regulator
MDESMASERFGALAQSSRLATLRMLVKAGGDGMPAGDIARALGVRHNTLSTHLSILENVDLLRSRREGRRIIYSVNFVALRELLAFLLEDCCGSAPKSSDAILNALLPRCCTSD